MRKVYYLALTIFFILFISNTVNPLNEVNQDFTFNFHIDGGQLLFPHNTISPDDDKIPVPIPKTVLLLSTGLFCFVVLRKRQKD